jgi:hypothetical protein
MTPPAARPSPLQYFLFVLVIAIGVASILATSIPTDSGTTTTTTSSGGGGGGAKCSTGFCLNNGQCCPRAYPDYTYGGHGYTAGCYARCPYVGDCGAATQCF